jgi:hypothetical protein
MGDNTCFHCGKEVPSQVYFEQNTGSVGYLVKVLFESGCFCPSCKHWFCGPCSDKDDLGLGSRNFKDGYLHLRCRGCQRNSKIQIVVTNPSWRASDSVSKTHQSETDRSLAITEIFNDRHGPAWLNIHVPTWLGILILIILVAVLPIFVFLNWLNGG